MLNNIVWVLSYIAVFLIGMLSMVAFIALAMRRSIKRLPTRRLKTRYTRDETDPPIGMFDNTGEE